MGHQGPAHGKHLLLAAAERAGQLVSSLLQPREPPVYHLQGLLKLILVFSRVGTQFQVLIHGQLGKYPPSLRYMGHPHGHNLVSRCPGNVLPLKVDFTRAGGNQSRNRVKNRGFPGAVGSD